MTRQLNPEVKLNIDELKGTVTAYGRTFAWDKNGAAHERERARARAIHEANNYGLNYLVNLETQKGLPLSVREQIYGTLTAPAEEKTASLRSSTAPDSAGEVSAVENRIATLEKQLGSESIKSRRAGIKRKIDAMRSLLAKKQSEADAEAAIAAEAAKNSPEAVLARKQAADAALVQAITPQVAT